MVKYFILTLERKQLYRIKRIKFDPNLKKPNRNDCRAYKN